MGDKIKVGFFSGPTEYSICLANALIEYCDVDFLYGVRFVRQGDESILDVLDSGIKRVPVNPHRIRDIRNLWSYHNVIKKLRNHDLIHLQAENLWFAMWRHLIGKIPVVFTVHDPYQHVGLPLGNLWYQDIAQKWNLSQSSRFFVHGRKMKDDLSRRYEIPSEHISVIPIGDSFFYETFQPVEIGTDPKKGKKVLFFGTVRKNKGLEYLIKAEPIISEKYSNYHICIAGRFEGDFEYYEKLMKNKNTFEILDGYIPNNQVATLFRNADIVVLPYISATQSAILPTAFSFGKPVVATKTGSMDEIIEHGKTGLLVPPGDETSLAEAIMDLLGDEGKCMRFGKRAKEVAETKLNWARIAGRTVQVYRSLVGL